MFTRYVKSATHVRQALFCSSSILQYWKP